MPNRLASETSPYLLQHAHNPVDWFPWGEEALQKAKRENKPILVSIGYAACHWCHVMEKESFEKEETAAIMNRHFVNIKIDREERPDLDHIYMDAVQVMTGSGGWPLNVFLTPEAKPFFGGTYFPPQRAFNRSSWNEVLLAVSTAFIEKRDEIEMQAKNLTEHLSQSNSFGLNTGTGEAVFHSQKIEETFQSLMRSADKVLGGFGSAPKFPQTFSIQFLLRYYYETGDQAALDQACLSLDKMVEGGIYDQAGGGFSRYATDNEWLVPHFEKMLYDNALLLSVLAEAYQATKRERYREVIEETLAFVERELMHPANGFYSALDADSEGVEGKFYCWERQEVINLLGDDAATFCDFFGVSEQGNWEGKNILHVTVSLENFAREKGRSVGDMAQIIEKGKTILLSERNKRVRPALDDKIILGWNALMNTACSKAFAATGHEKYRQLAIDNMLFLLQHFNSSTGGLFHHTWKNDEAKNFAFIDDYAFLIQALIHLQEITGNTDWLLKAREITEYVLGNFSEPGTDFFFFTDTKQQDVIVWKKEVYDGATPSGNATLAYNVYQLSVLLNVPEFRQRSKKMVISLSSAIAHYPTSFGVWATLLTEMVYGTEEIVVFGARAPLLAKKVLAEYIPHKVFMSSEKPDENLPLLIGKTPTDKPLIYLCREYSCLKPVSGVGELLELIK
jgi:uncharacterized protein YyaL (SSP411 family)